jgi:hypothetical protein
MASLHRLRETSASWEASEPVIVRMMERFIQPAN